MSQQPQTENAEQFNSNLAAFIFIIAFAVITGLIFANAPVRDTTPEDEQQVVLAQATHTAVPSATALPLTSTPMPTSTPLPSATPTDVPTATSTTEPVAQTETTAGAETVSASYDPALVERGQFLFPQCSACHGADARGLPNLGKNLVESEFVASQTDDELVQFIITGRPIWDPANTTGIDMPGKGGNPALTTEDIEAIVAYIRTLSAQNGG